MRRSLPLRTRTRRPPWPTTPSYGLAAYIYTCDIAWAFRTFEALDFGINDINPASAVAPFGGMKDSGLGREGVHEGIDEYLETKLGDFAI